jgi:hypothetical protein
MEEIIKQIRRKRQEYIKEYLSFLWLPSLSWDFNLLLISMSCIKGEETASKISLL